MARMKRSLGEKMERLRRALRDDLSEERLLGLLVAMGDTNRSLNRRLGVAERAFAELRRGKGKGYAHCLGRAAARQAAVQAELKLERRGQQLRAMARRLKEANAELGELCNTEREMPDDELQGHLSAAFPSVNFERIMFGAAGRPKGGEE